MPIHKSYSVSRLITTFLILLFLATVLLSVFYFISFTQITYNNNLDFFKTSTKKNAVNLSNELILAQQQLVWIATNIGKESFWMTDNPYERMLYRQNMNHSLYGILHNSDIVDAAMIVQSGSDVIIECHKMPEETFLRLLDTYNSRNSVRPVSPSLFSAKQDSEPSHLVMRQPVTSFNPSYLFMQTVANAYLAISLDHLLPEPTDESIQCLSIASGDTLRVYYSNGVGADTLPASFSLSELKQNAQINMNGVTHIAILESLDYGDMYLLCLVPRYLLIDQMQHILLHGVMLVLLVFILTIIGILSTTRLVNRPVRDIVNDMQRIRQGDYGFRLRFSKAKEMQEISAGVNDVLDELEKRTILMTKTQKNLYELRLLHRESQILALQSQINPHFLYNTLECVRSIAQTYRVPEIPKVLSAMIRIYRYSASKNNMGTIESEMQCGKDYAEIMQIRFGDRFRFHFQIEDPMITSAPVPRMVLQPLLENAVNHGFANQMENGEVMVGSFYRNNAVTMYVRDNGQGISAQRLVDLRKHLDEDKVTEKKEGHIGLYNVHQRLRREFGDAYGLTIESVEGEYTKVEITIPSASH
ncbi:MAG: sensor histidine kinase [Oscillospiraceae bacterium]